MTRRAASACYNLRPFNDLPPPPDDHRPRGAPVTPKLYIRTFGCQMNEYDSDKMADVLAADGGFALTDRPEDADVILFNTCSVREKAQERVFHDLGRVRALKAEQARISSSASAAASRARKAPASSGARRTSTSCSARRRCIGCRRSSARGARPARRRSTSRFPAIEKFDHLPPPRVDGASAFVSIMEGCSKYCTFCVVPYTRGEEVSRPFDDVLTEVADLADQGVMEVTLLGQNVNAYRAPMGDRAERTPTSPRCSNTSPTFPASSASATRRRIRRR